MVRRRRVLVVDDEPLLRRALWRILKSEFDLELAESAEKALELLRSRAFDIILTDHDMPEHDGRWLLEQVQAEHPHVRRILTSGRSPTGIDEHLASGLVQCFIPKPAALEDLLPALRGR